MTGATTKKEAAPIIHEFDVSCEDTTHVVRLRANGRLDFTEHWVDVIGSPYRLAQRDGSLEARIVEAKLAGRLHRDRKKTCLSFPDIFRSWSRDLELLIFSCRGNAKAHGFMSAIGEKVRRTRNEDRADLATCTNHERRMREATHFMRRKIQEEHKRQSGQESVVPMFLTLRESGRGANSGVSFSRWYRNVYRSEVPIMVLQYRSRYFVTLDAHRVKQRGCVRVLALTQTPFDALNHPQRAQAKLPIRVNYVGVSGRQLLWVSPHMRLDASYLH